MSGIVGSYIYRSAAKIPFVILVTEKKEDGATCFTVVQDPWSKVLPGQKVKIRGKHLENAGGYPSLFECVFIEVGASPGIVITAEELAKEFAANREATNKKYADKFVIVSGLISEKTKDNDSFMYVLLKGTDKVRVKGGFETDLADLLKVGENVRIVGAYSKFSTGEEINLSVAFPLKGP